MSTVRPQQGPRSILKRERSFSEDAPEAPRKRVRFADLPEQNEVHALVRRYCSTLGQESFERVRELARDAGILKFQENEAYDDERERMRDRGPVRRRNRFSKRGLCMALATHYTLGEMDALIRVDELDEELVDPVTYEPLTEPHLIPETGNTYNLSTIQQLQRAEDPMTRAPFFRDSTVLNRVVRSLVYKHFERFGSRPPVEHLIGDPAPQGPQRQQRQQGAQGAQVAPPALEPALYDVDDAEEPDSNLLIPYDEIREEGPPSPNLVPGRAQAEPEIIDLT